MIELKKKINPIEIILHYLIVFFPIFFFFRSFFLNFILITISILFLILSIKIKYNFLKKKYNIFLLVFFFYIIFSNLILNQDHVTVIKSIFLLKFFFLFNSIIFVYSRVSKKFLEKSLIYLLFFIAIISLDFLKQYITGSNFIGLKPYFCSSNILECQRYSGFFGKELVFGGYFSTIIISFFLLLKILKQNNNLVNFFPIFILIVIFLSGERSAFLLALVFSIIYYSHIIDFNFKNILGIFFSICISILLINFSVKDTTKSRYYTDIIQLIDFNQPNFLNALKLTPWGLHYNASVLMIAEKPLVGNGLKSFRIKCKEYEVENSENSGYKVCSTHPHNFHLEILVDTGLIGYLSFLMFLFYLFKDSQKQNISNELIFNLITIIILIFIFLPRPTGSFFSTFFGSIFWFFISSLFGYKKFIIHTKKF